jgi:hypothetical protein
VGRWAAPVGSALAAPAADSMPTPRKPLLCRLKRHKWVRHSTEDGEGYFQCAACGTDGYEVEFDYHNPSVGSMRLLSSKKHRGGRGGG